MITGVKIRIAWKPITMNLEVNVIEVNVIKVII